MIRMTIAATLLASASIAAAQPAQPAQPAPAQAPTPPPVRAPAPTAAPAAAPDPARLAAAEQLVAAMWSDELIARGIEIALNQEVPGWSAPPADPRDPFHAERVRLRQQATRDELLRTVRGFAPEMRSLVARFYASRLAVAELEEAARFFASPAGRRSITGAFESMRHAEALRNFRPEFDPQLLVEGIRVAMRMEAETRHLSPPPPPPPSAQAERERRRAERRERSQSERRRPRREERAETPVVADESAAPRPPPPPADPARLEAARRAAEVMLPDEAFRQPLPLQATVEAVLDLPVSAFLPIAPPGIIDIHGSLAQAAQARDPHFRERMRIMSRILSEELPQLLPRAAPPFRAFIAELYARTFTVSELDDISRFYATAAGRALARESFTSLVDPQFVRGLLLLMPRAAAEGLAAMIRIGQATAHLPPPPDAPPPPANERARERQGSDDR